MANLDKKVINKKNAMLVGKVKSGRTNRENDLLLFCYVYGNKRGERIYKKMQNLMGEGKYDIR